MINGRPGGNCGTAARRSMTGGYSSGAVGGSVRRPSSRPTVARSRGGKKERIIRIEAATKTETRPPLREKAQRRACQMPGQAGHDVWLVVHNVVMLNMFRSTAILAETMIFVGPTALHVVVLGMV